MTDPGCTVEVGGRYFATVDAEGYWALDLVLRPGDNSTTFAATDPETGSRTIQAIRVRYEPPEIDEADVEFFDDFEQYEVNTYPSDGGWYEEWSGAGAWVSDQRAHSGKQSFRLAGNASWVRTDALALDLSDVHTLTYSLAVNSSSEGEAGAEIGFFVRTKPNESWAYNSFHFRNDGLIAVKGTGWRIGGPPDLDQGHTDLRWEYDRWYQLKAQIDYETDTVSFWLDGDLLFADLVAAPRDASSIFSIANYYGVYGVAYFDDVSITLEY